MSKRPYDVAGMGDFVAQRLVRISERAGKLARGVGLFAVAGGTLAYVVGLFVFPPSFRAWWAVAGFVACSTPAVAVFVTARRLKRVRTTVVETAAELRSIANDRDIRKALVDFVDRDEARETTTPLIKVAKELHTLRKAVGGRKGQLINVWQTITALTTLPGLIALGIVGTFGLLAFSAIAVAVRLVLLGTG